MIWQSLLCRWERKAKTAWLGKACKIKGASTEKDLQKGQIRNKRFFLREHTNKSWQWKRTCTSFWTAAQETCHSGHFPRARWRIPLREYGLANKPAHIPHNMPKEVKVQIARWHQGGIPMGKLHTSAWISLKIWEGTGKPRMISHQFNVAFQRVHVSNIPPHFPHPKSQVSSEFWVKNREPLQEGLCICFAASQSLKACKISEAQDVLARSTSLRSAWRACLRVALLEDNKPL